MPRTDSSIELSPASELRAQPTDVDIYEIGRRIAVAIPKRVFEYGTSKCTPGLRMKTSRNASSRAVKA